MSVAEIFVKFALCRDSLSRFSEESFALIEEQTTIRVQKLAFHQGGQAQTVGMSQKASKSCRQSAAAALVLRWIRTVDISGMSETNDSNLDWVRILWFDVLRCARSVEPPRTGVEGAKRRAHCSKVNAFCAQAGVYGTRDRERETDSGKSDSFFQYGNVALFVVKLIIVAIRFVVFVGSARASSLAKKIVFFCALFMSRWSWKWSDPRQWTEQDFMSEDD